MTCEYKLTNIIRGSMIYAVGDTAAALIAHEFSVLRLVGILIIGGTLYAFEIPNYFNWIDKKVSHTANFKAKLTRASLAILYFNPLWIARHILLIKLLMGQYQQIGWGLITIGAISFLVNIPISISANYLIQNKIALRHRFIASAVFSGLMAVYYSLSAVWFG